MLHLPQLAREHSGAIEKAETVKLYHLEQLGLAIAGDEALVYLRMTGGDPNHAAELAWSNQKGKRATQEHPQPPVTDNERRRSCSRRWFGFI
jgi:hypothetical protein